MVTDSNKDSEKITILKRLNKNEFSNLLIEMYTREKLPLEFIAKCFNTTKKNISVNLRLFGIPGRNIEDQWKIAQDNTTFPEITAEQKQLLIGGLLGDGGLSKSKTNRGYTYREFHCLEQKDYALWKANFLNVKLIKKVYWENRIKGLDKNYHGRVGIFEQYGFSLLNHPYINFLHSKFYTPKKSIPIELMDELGPLGLAVWYMDDGSYLKTNGKKRTNIALYHKFNNLDEKNFLIKFFKDKFGMDCKIYSRPTCEVIRFNTESSKKFIRIIKHYVESIPCMRYKINQDMPEKDEYLMTIPSYAEKIFVEYENTNEPTEAYNNLFLIKSRIKEITSNPKGISKQKILDSVKYLNCLIQELV